VKLSVALVQLDATEDVERNVETAVALADEAAADARLVALPEYLQGLLRARAIENGA
jgi:predicted amidohydrolase